MNEEGRIDYIEIPVTDLEKTRGFLQDLFGWTFSQDIFDFPGGRRFHFVEPAGTEFAMWSST